MEGAAGWTATGSPTWSLRRNVPPLPVLLLLLGGLASAQLPSVPGLTLSPEVSVVPSEIRTTESISPSSQYSDIITTMGQTEAENPSLIYNTTQQIMDSMVNDTSPTDSVKDYVTTHLEGFITTESSTLSSFQPTDSGLSDTSTPHFMVYPYTPSSSTLTSSDTSQLFSLSSSSSPSLSSLSTLPYQPTAPAMTVPDDSSTNVPFTVNVPLGNTVSSTSDISDFPETTTNIKKLDMPSQNLVEPLMVAVTTLSTEDSTKQTSQFSQGDVVTVLEATSLSVESQSTSSTSSTSVSNSTSSVPLDTTDFSNLESHISEASTLIGSTSPESVSSSTVFVESSSLSLPSIPVTSSVSVPAPTPLEKSSTSVDVSHNTSFSQTTITFTPVPESSATLISLETTSTTSSMSTSDTGVLSSVETVTLSPSTTTHLSNSTTEILEKNTEITTVGAKSDPYFTLPELRTVSKGALEEQTSTSVYVTTEQSTLFETSQNSSGLNFDNKTMSSTIQPTMELGTSLSVEVTTSGIGLTSTDSTLTRIVAISNTETTERVTLLSSTSTETSLETDSRNKTVPIFTSVAKYNTLDTTTPTSSTQPRESASTMSAEESIDLKHSTSQVATGTEMSVVKLTTTLVSDTTSGEKSEGTILETTTSVNQSTELSSASTSETSSTITGTTVTKSPTANTETYQTNGTGVSHSVTYTVDNTEFTSSVTDTRLTASNVVSKLDEVTSFDISMETTTRPVSNDVTTDNPNYVTNNTTDFPLTTSARTISDTFSTLTTDINTYNPGTGSTPISQHTTNVPHDFSQQSTTLTSPVTDSVMLIPNASSTLPNTSYQSTSAEITHEPTSTTEEVTSSSTTTSSDITLQPSITDVFTQLTSSSSNTEIPKSTVYSTTNVYTQTVQALGSTINTHGSTQRELDTSTANTLSNSPTPSGELITYFNTGTKQSNSPTLSTSELRLSAETAMAYTVTEIENNNVIFTTKLSVSHASSTSSLTESSTKIATLSTEETSKTTESNARSTYPDSTVSSSQISSTSLPRTSSETSTSLSGSLTETSTSPSGSLSQTSTSTSGSSSETRESPAGSSSETSTSTPRFSSETSTSPSGSSFDTNTSPPGSSPQTSTSTPGSSSETSESPVGSSSETSTSAPRFSSETSTRLLGSSSETSTISPRPSSKTSTSPPGSSSETSTSPPGSLDETSTSASGSSSETSTSPPGSLSETSTSPPGSLNETSTSPPGSTSETSTSPPGSTSETNTSPPRPSSDTSTSAPGSSSRTSTIPLLSSSQTSATSTPVASSQTSSTNPSLSSSSTSSTSPPETPTEMSISNGTAITLPSISTQSFQSMTHFSGSTMQFTPNSQTAVTMTLPTTESTAYMTSSGELQYASNTTQELSPSSSHSSSSSPPTELSMSNGTTSLPTGSTQGFQSMADFSDSTVQFTSNPQSTINMTLSVTESLPLTTSKQNHTIQTTLEFSTKTLNETSITASLPTSKTLQETEANSVTNASSSFINISSFTTQSTTQATPLSTTKGNVTLTAYNTAENSTDLRSSTPSEGSPILTDNTQSTPNPFHQTTSHMSSTAIPSSISPSLPYTTSVVPTNMSGSLSTVSTMASSAEVSTNSPTGSTAQNVTSSNMTLTVSTNHVSVLNTLLTSPITRTQQTQTFDVTPKPTNITTTNVTEHTPTTVLPVPAITTAVTPPPTTTTVTTATTTTHASTTVTTTTVSGTTTTSTVLPPKTTTSAATTTMMSRNLTTAPLIPVANVTTALGPTPTTTLSTLPPTPSPFECQLSTETMVKTVISLRERTNTSFIWQNFAEFINDTLNKALKLPIQVYINTTDSTIQFPQVTIGYSVSVNSSIYIPSAIVSILTRSGVFNVSDLKNRLPIAMVPVVAETFLTEPAINFTVKTVLKLMVTGGDVSACVYVRNMEKKLQTAFEKAEVTKNGMSSNSLSVQILSTSKVEQSLTLIYVVRNGSSLLDGITASSLLNVLSGELVGYYLENPPSIIAEPLYYPMIDTSEKTVNYWVVTVIQGVSSDLLGPNNQSFARQLEEGLAKLFQLSGQQSRRFKRATTVGNYIVQMVKMQRLSGPNNLAELTYYAKKDGQPILGTVAAKQLSTIDPQTMALTLGYIVRVQANPVVQKPANNLWIIAAVLAPIAVVTVIIIIITAVLCRKNKSDFKSENLSNMPPRTKPVQGFDYAKQHLGQQGGDEDGLPVHETVVPSLNLDRDSIKDGSTEKMLKSSDTRKSRSPCENGSVISNESEEASSDGSTPQKRMAQHRMTKDGTGKWNGLKKSKQKIVPISDEEEGNQAFDKHGKMVTDPFDSSSGSVKLIAIKPVSLPPSLNVTDRSQEMSIINGEVNKALKQKSDIEHYRNKLRLKAKRKGYYDFPPVDHQSLTDRKKKLYDKAQMEIDRVLDTKADHSLPFVEQKNRQPSMKNHPYRSRQSLNSPSPGETEMDLLVTQERARRGIRNSGYDTEPEMIEETNIDRVKQARTFIKPRQGKGHSETSTLSSQPSIDEVRQQMHMLLEEAFSLASAGHGAPKRQQDPYASAQQLPYSEVVTSAPGTMARPRMQWVPTYGPEMYQYSLPRPTYRFSQLPEMVMGSPPPPVPPRTGPVAVPSLQRSTSDMAKKSRMAEPAVTEPGPGNSVPAVFAIPGNRSGYSGYYIPQPPAAYRNQAWMSYGENDLPGQWADSVPLPGYIEAYPRSRYPQNSPSRLPRQFGHPVNPHPSLDHAAGPSIGASQQSLADPDTPEASITNLSTAALVKAIREEVAKLANKKVDMFEFQV